MIDQDKPTRARKRTVLLGRCRKECVVQLWREVKGREREWRGVWSGGQGCSFITSHSGPGVAFRETDSERSGLDSISHKSWHATLMDVGHKASRSDMRRATWRTMGKCECSRLMSMRSGSEEGMMERKRDGDIERSEVRRGGLRRTSGPRAECEKSLWGDCNRIKWDTAMIQLSSCGFRPMLLTVSCIKAMKTLKYLVIYLQW